MVKEYTISELADILKISKQATNKKISKLETCGLKVTMRSINNRPTKIVFLNDNQLNEMISGTIGNQLETEYSNHINQPTSNHKIENNQPPQQPETSTNYEIMQLLVKYAEKAGKYDMIEDKKKEYQQDIKYWQEQYFCKENEIKALIKTNTQLEAENQQLKEQLNKKGFLGLFKK